LELFGVSIDKRFYNGFSMHADNKGPPNLAMVNQTEKTEGFVRFKGWGHLTTKRSLPCHFKTAEGLKEDPNCQERVLPITITAKEAAIEVYDQDFSFIKLFFKPALGNADNYIVKAFCQTLQEISNDEWEKESVVQYEMTLRSRLDNLKIIEAIEQIQSIFDDLGEYVGPATKLELDDLINQLINKNYNNTYSDMIKHLNTAITDKILPMLQIIYSTHSKLDFDSISDRINVIRLMIMTHKGRKDPLNLTADTKK
jgi:hypothetical protein